MIQRDACHVASHRVMLHILSASYCRNVVLMSYDARLKCLSATYAATFEKAFSTLCVMKSISKRYLRSMFHWLRSRLYLLMRLAACTCVDGRFLCSTSLWGPSTTLPIFTGPKGEYS